jgi:hypothetical protein
MSDSRMRIYDGTGRKVGNDEAASKILWRDEIVSQAAAQRISNRYLH